LLQHSQPEYKEQSLHPHRILISIPPPSAGGTNSNESVLTLYVVL